MSTSPNQAEPTESAKTVRRVQLDLGPKMFDRLVKLKDETEAATYAEVIRNALKLYAFTVDQHQDGNQFMIRYPDGKIVPAPIRPMT